MGHLFPRASSDPYKGCHKVSAIYLYPACQAGRTSGSLTAIWSNTTSLASLLQKTWWQWKFLCFNKDQSKEFIEAPDRLSSLWAHLSHPDHQAVPLIPQLTFCLSCIKKLLFLDDSPFCAVSSIPLQSDLFTPDLSHFESFPVLTWTIFCLLPPHTPTFVSFTLYEMDAKVFIWAPNLWYATYFPALPLMCLKHFQVSYKLQLFKILLSMLTSCTHWFDHSSIL